MQLISGRKTGAVATLQRALLRCGSLFFWAGVNVRLGLYRLGWLARKRVSRPVICIGNLTVGGTGKTPAVANVIAMLQELGCSKPVILSRGYRGGEAGNDEMRVLEELCPNVPHKQDADRVKIARQAIEEGAEVLVLDDGFSHLRLHRDLDILLLDSLNPFGYGRMLPRGLLREPIRGVRRAQIAILTRSDVAGPDRLRDLEDTIRCIGFTGEVLHAAHTPVKLLRIDDGEELEPSFLSGKTIAPFCGIANPTGFERTLESLGATICAAGVLELDDHARLSAAEVERDVLPFLRAARDAGAEAAVCTQKDAVKIRAEQSCQQAGLPVYELRVRFEITRGAEKLRACLRKILDLQAEAAATP